MRHIQLFEEYNPDALNVHKLYRDKILSEFSLIYKKVTAEVDDFLQGWENNPSNKEPENPNAPDPLDALIETWKSFTSKNRLAWEAMVKPYEESPIYWKEVREDRNPLRAVSEVANTMWILGKSSNNLKIEGGLSYEAILQKYIEKNPGSAGDVYIPKYAGKSMDYINTIKDIANMGLF